MTTRPELLSYGMLGNALDIPGMGLCTPIWAIFPPQFSYSIASSQVASQKGLSFTVMLRTDCECGHRVIQFVEAWP